MISEGMLSSDSDVGYATIKKFFIHSLINGSTALSFTHMVGLLERGISSLQGCYLHPEQHRHRINAHTNIHAFDCVATVIGTLETYYIIS
jgi:hypothetical protein